MKRKGTLNPSKLSSSLEVKEGIKLIKSEEDLENVSRDLFSAQNSSRNSFSIISFWIWVKIGRYYQLDNKSPAQGLNKLVVKRKNFKVLSSGKM